MFWRGSIFFCDSHTNYFLRSETSLKSMCRKSCHCLVFVCKNVALRSFVWKRTFFLPFQTELHVHMMRSLIAFLACAKTQWWLQTVPSLMEACTFTGARDMVASSLVRSHKLDSTPWHWRKILLDRTVLYRICLCTNLPSDGLSSLTAV